MPADVLSSCIVMLPWVRLEARPFHIPPRIALLGWLDCSEWTNLGVGAGSVNPREHVIT